MIGSHPWPGVMRSFAASTRLGPRQTRRRAIPSVVTPERFAKGRSFEQYVTYISTPENLARETNTGPRQDFGAFFHEAFERSHLTDDQEAALKWLVSRANGPANMLVISEEWSSDCRRD